MVAVNLKKSNLFFKKPIYVGFGILDISKLLMYRFHYEYVKAKYGKRASLLFTGTDSIETSDLYADMFDNKTVFDTSHYYPADPLYDVTNAKVIGKMKDETAGQQIREFVGLKAKDYSMMIEDTKKINVDKTDITHVESKKDQETIIEETEKKRAKDVSKVVINKQLKHSTYKDALIGQKCSHHDMNFIRSDCQQFYCVTMMISDLC